MEQVKIFEMPLPGYLGFPAFALECFTMYVFVRVVAVRVFGVQFKPHTPENRGNRASRTPAGHGRTIAL